MPCPEQVHTVTEVYSPTERTPEIRSERAAISKQYSDLLLFC